MVSEKKPALKAAFSGDYRPHSGFQPQEELFDEWGSAAPRRQWILLTLPCGLDALQPVTQQEAAS